MNGFEKSELISFLMVGVGIVGMVLYCFSQLPVHQ